MGGKNECVRVGVGLAGLSALALAVGNAARAAGGGGTASSAPGVEPDEIALSVTLDEHLFVNAAADANYNGGGEITFSGARAAHGLSIDPLLGVLDRALGIGAGGDHDHGPAPAHALVAGLLIFTPEDLSAHEPVPGDRPYASLFFVSNGRRYVTDAGSVAYNSDLTIGALGLAAASGVQRGLHRLTDSVRPEGWPHQISAGGEPTARYSLARQQLLGRHLSDGWGGSDWKWTAAGSVGTVTEASAALSVRWGRITSPWWSSTPEQSMYTLEAQPALPPSASGATELFVLAGARFKLRAYNAFLEGQFRHSDLRYGGSEVNIPLGEAWLGCELRTPSGWELRYLVRWESPELKSGIDSRAFMWGSLTVSKSFMR